MPESDWLWGKDLRAVERFCVFLLKALESFGENIFQRKKVFQDGSALCHLSCIAEQLIHHMTDAEGLNPFTEITDRLSQAKFQ
jgi:hypothetical protein